MSKEKQISAFLDDSGKIKQVPSPSRTKIPVLSYLAAKFEAERTYSEKEVNSIINEWHTFGDYFLLRRLLIDYKFMERTPNGERYWLTIKEVKKEGDI